MEKNEIKLTWNQIFERSVLFNAIPLAGLAGKTLSEVIMLQVDYQRKVNAFEDKMGDALKKLKEEKYPDFDEEAGKPEADRKEGFKEMMESLEKEYGELRASEANAEGEVPARRLTQETFDGICMAGAEGEVTLPGRTASTPITMPRGELLRVLATLIE